MVPPLRRGDGQVRDADFMRLVGIPLRRGDGRNMLRSCGLACTYPSQG